MMRAAVANSNLITTPRLVPTLFVWEDICALDAGSRLGHHIGDRIAPFLIVGRLFVPGRVVGGAIYLDQDKTSRVILLLDHVESRNAGFLNAVGGVLNGCRLERIDPVGLNLYMNVDY
jgi:hypothetical protein